MAALNDSVMRPAKEIAKVAFNAATATSSSAMPASASSFLLVQLYATVNCRIAPFKKSYTVGTDDAGANSMPLPANTPMVFKISPEHLISVIGETASGSLYITIME